AKISYGICDDLLSTLMAASLKPKLICPAMNVNMWNNLPNIENLNRLLSRGLHVLEPESGDLACGYQGLGRLPETPQIINKIHEILHNKSLKNIKLLITSGPTREAIDPVRFISNPSSGKMGLALAHEAHLRGAQVTLIVGPTDLSYPKNIETIFVESAIEMHEKVQEKIEASDVFIASAAVSDFRPAQVLKHKEKKIDADLEMKLEKNPDILAEVGKSRKSHQVLVGFAAETQFLETEATRKLNDKNLDMICANNVANKKIGFGSDMNEMSFYFKEEAPIKLPLLQKSEIACLILDQVERFIQQKKN
ncbi:MAG: bifunctional phosphopantothenoylcysteine decarboxylase/phosphopantothenate--cysteine ligase CoaBC, partial [Deltaproteobacteria bacterium]|nr:bifunctional phosphopantothenoylcysteine decarboxylase/phosphopantothenate--cysteine ligase CoaBC [Deltaproteobacteria bacterium]